MHNTVKSVCENRAPNSQPSPAIPRIIMLYGDHQVSGMGKIWILGTNFLGSYISFLETHSYKVLYTKHSLNLQRGPVSAWFVTLV